ncbi:preprotein translocase subunit YajC [Micrococcus sp.]|uniref:preprotein translocase subunit YajC n=1 Tax=Micrococcus sp. TaxID=1271 RepID=UPI002A91C97B|nr:preprotein translocase subunit YajC [Micrococcus sp.]MDY6055488.1 preprotein translocase subunit YajC [Micrococcus sp.]
MPQHILTMPVIAQQAAVSGSNIFMLVMFGALLVLMFLSFRRARKVQAQQAEMRRGLTPGQEVMTASGIFGTVVTIDEARQRITLEVAPGTRLQMHLQGITDVVEPEVPAAAAAPVTETGGSSAAAPSVESNAYGEANPYGEPGDHREAGPAGPAGETGRRDPA